MAGRSQPTLRTIEDKNLLLREIQDLNSRLATLERIVQVMSEERRTDQGMLARLERDVSRNVLSGATNASAASVALGLNRSPQAFARSVAEQTAPTVNDDANRGFGEFSRWLDRSTGTIYECVDSTVGAAVWNVSS